MRKGNPRANEHLCQHDNHLCCGNTFFGSFYANKKGKIDIEYTGSTKKLCDQMDVEYKFISAMKSENMSYVLKEDLLFIYGERMDADGAKKNIEIMRFKVDR